MALPLTSRGCLAGWRSPQSHPMLEKLTRALARQKAWELARETAVEKDVSGQGSLFLRSASSCMIQLGLVAFGVIRPSLKMLQI